jgi:hexokinase
MNRLQLKKVFDNFLQELINAEKGNTTSFAYIKHPLLPQPLIQSTEPFQVLVVGGTIFHIALVKKEGAKTRILKLHSENQPSFKTSNDFLDYLDNHMYPDVSGVAVNFAYPLYPVFRKNKYDGTLISESKEFQFQGLIGQMVGETIEEFILKKRHQVVNVSLANDAFCLLLSGIDAYPKEALMGAIIGTGTNASFFHNDVAINLESGSFNKFTASSECIKIDNDSFRPGTALFEKEIAGEYLYQHFNILINKGVISHPLISSTKELSGIALKNEGSEASLLARRILEKSAGYFAMQIAGIAAFKNHDMTCIVEGSMYWDDLLYRKFVDQYLEKLSLGLKIQIVRVENSSIMGAAKLII